MKAVEEVAATVGVTAAAAAVGVSPATVYRRRKPPVHGPRPPRPTPARALSPEEVDRALGILHDPRFVDFAPRTIVAVLLDEGDYIASVSTLYRLLEKYGEIKERRKQLRHERYAAPQLHADAPNRPFGEWREVFPHATCVVALVDRLVHRAQVVAIEGESFRLKEAKERETLRAKRRREKASGG